MLDVANVLAGARFNSGAPASWSEGDFNHDGVFDMLDVADLMSTGIYAADSYNAAETSASVAAVPEPAMATLSAVAIGFTVVMRMIQPRKPPHERETCAETAHHRVP